MFKTNLILIKFCVLCLCFCTSFLSILCFHMQMSPFKSLAVKGGCNKGKEPMIDVDEPSLKLKRTCFSTGVYDLDLFRSMLHSRPTGASFEMLHYWLKGPLINTLS